MPDTTTYFVKHGYVVAQDGTWLPGVYDTQVTAVKAANLPDECLRELSERHELITLEILDRSRVL